MTLPKRLATPRLSSQVNLCKGHKNSQMHSNSSSKSNNNNLRGHPIRLAGLLGAVLKLDGVVEVEEVELPMQLAVEAQMNITGLCLPSVS